MSVDHALDFSCLAHRIECRCYVGYLNDFGRDGFPCSRVRIGKERSVDFLKKFAKALDAVILLEPCARTYTAIRSLLFRSVLVHFDLFRVLISVDQVFQ